MEGVVLLPSALAITTGSPPSMTATQELVVPRSIPIIFPIFFLLHFSLDASFVIFKDPLMGLFILLWETGPSLHSGIFDGRGFFTFKPGVC
jgi:hypothetical protein